MSAEALLTTAYTILLGLVACVVIGTVVLAWEESE